MRWCDLKPLQSISGSSSLTIIFKFYKCNVMPPRYQANFFETREPRQKVKAVNTGKCINKFVEQLLAIGLGKLITFNQKSQLEWMHLT